MMKWRLPLWGKITLATFIVEGVMLAALLVGHLRHTEQILGAQADARIESLRPLLNSALAGPLVQRDLGALNEIVEEAYRSDGFTYLVLLDRDGRRLAAAGLPADQPLPPISPSLKNLAEAPVLHAHTSLNIGGHQYGDLRFGLSTEFFQNARQESIRIVVFVGVLGMALSLFVLVLVGYWLTRGLSQLTEASHAIADGNFDARLPESSADEVGQLAAAFEKMSHQLKARLAELKDSEQRFFAIANYTYDLELWIDPQGRTIWVNPSAERVLGLSPENCLKTPGFPLSMIVESDRAEAQSRFSEALRGSTGEGFQFRMMRNDGASFWAAVNWHPIFGRDNQFLGIRASVRDISELKHSEQRALEYLSATKEERARLMALLSAMNLGVLFVGPEGRVIYHNPAFNQLWMLPPDQDLLGVDVHHVFSESECKLVDATGFMAHVDFLLASRETSEAFEIPIKDGRLANILSFPVFERESHYIGLLWVFEDITGERQTAEQLLYLAERDSLTGLYNRHRFQIELERMLQESARNTISAALLFFDLDDFKAINDHFGHKAGDATLIRVAGEVSGLTRRHEMLFRLGGDEFAILMPNATEQQATMLAERVVRAIAQIPFRLEGQVMHISSSVGIALFPTHAADQEQLVIRADSAMYQAKQAGKNAWRLYSADLDQTPEIVNRLSWNERLGRALAANLFELHYQGVYNAKTRQLLHVEALIRLRDEETGELVSPGLFIPIAEKSNRILEIDRWVLLQAVRVLASNLAAPPIAVNLSGRSFDDPALPRFIADLLSANDVQPSRMIIEITETAAVSDLADAERFIEALKLTGCSVCLDDFGAGFASFAYLKHIRVDTIKLDGMFIRNLPHDHENQVFVRGMVEVARGLGKTTVAECVEDEATLKLLAKLGVDKAQGYFLDRPQANHPALFSAHATGEKA